MSQETENIESIERQKRRAKAEKNSTRNDMKQHADKLIQGFQKLGESHSRRAIWELFQNAIDLVDSSAEIIIVHTADALTFKHNGEPFDDNTLNCLIKQVSSKSFGNEKKQNDIDEQVGQYGTGFITTHSFGRKLMLTSSIKDGDMFIPLANFLIDRSPKDSPTLIDNILLQQETVFDLIEKGTYVDERASFTEFAYLTESDLQKRYALDAVNDIPNILPYVMELNSKIEKVTVTDITGVNTVYERKSAPDTDAKKTLLEIDGREKQIHTLKDLNEGITIILPIDNDNNAFELSEKLPRLFLYYPLIGTEKFGINFIVHSKYFSPTEPRDGVHLKSENEQVKENEDANRKIIHMASEMVFKYMEENVPEIKNPINLAKVNFNVTVDDKFLREYYQELKKQWVNKFMDLPLVETTEGHIKPANSLFFHEELLQDENTENGIYSIVSEFWSNIPKKDLIRQWTQIFNEWDIQQPESYLKTEDIVKKVAARGKLVEFQGHENLKEFYKYIIANGHDKLFADYSLLPNIKGEFRKFSELNTSLDLPDKLIEIADVIASDIPKRHIDPTFKFTLNLNPFNRKNYSDEIRNVINAAISDDSSIDLLQIEYRNQLLDYCKIAPNKESQSVPARLVKMICKHFDYSEELIEIPATPNDDIDNRAIQKKLIRIFLNYISFKDSVWVKTNLEYLLNFVETMFGYKEYDDLYQTLRFFPNQLNELCVLSTLQIDGNIPLKIKSWYNDIVKPDKLVGATLVEDNFEKFLINKETKTTNSLTEKIESIFSADGQYTSINLHPYKNVILEIINEISTHSEWAKYFPILNSKRANVMLDSVTNEEIKADVFKIISLKPEEIKKLGSLAASGKMNRIIELGMQALRDEERKHTDFQYKSAIGTHLEEVLKQRLSGIIPDEIKAKPESEQNGQDIIIYIGTTPVYYIEVKSKWVSETPIRMSKNQTLKSSKNSDRYALCSIDMVGYEEPDRTAVHSIETIKDRIWFNTDIGTKVTHLVEVLEQADLADKIRLDGDFRTYIPKWYIDEGERMDAFEEYLIGKLKEFYTKQHQKQKTEVSE